MFSLFSPAMFQVDSGSLRLAWYFKHSFILDAFGVEEFFASGAFVALRDKQVQFLLTKSTGVVL